MKIVVLDGNAMNRGDLSWEALEKLGTTTIYERTPAEKVIERCADADAIIVNKVKITLDVIKSLPNLKYIGLSSTGYDVVDIKAADDADIVCTNVPAYSTVDVAQHVFAFILNQTNFVEKFANDNRAGRWSSSEDFCYWDKALTRLEGKTFGVVGFGNIGLKVAKIANAFGMKVVAATSKPQVKLPAFLTRRTITELLETSDFVSLHCPLTPETRHMISESQLDLMKNDAVLINTARGGLVDEQALVKALKNNKIAAYCADVMDQEPPKADNELLKLDNVHITPHVAWATKQAREVLLNVCCQNLEAFISGKPINVVTTNISTKKNIKK